MEGAEPQPAVIQVLQRTFTLLDILARHPDPIPLKRISAEAGLHPSTTHRILNDLAGGGFVERTRPGHYRLGMRLLELGNVVRGRLHISDIARQPMRALFEQIRQPVSVSRREGDEVVFVERALSERAGFQVAHAIGSRAPLHLSAAGKVFLAQDEARLVRDYAARTGLRGNTAHSIVETSALERELATVRAVGVAKDDEELQLGVRCLATAIHDDHGGVTAALSISAPATQMRDDYRDGLLATAAVISTALGYRGR